MKWLDKTDNSLTLPRLLKHPAAPSNAFFHVIHKLTETEYGLRHGDVK